MELDDVGVMSCSSSVFYFENSLSQYTYFDIFLSSLNFKTYVNAPLFSVTKNYKYVGAVAVHQQILCDRVCGHIHNFSTDYYSIA